MADDGQPIILGRIPSQQTKIDEKDETKNLLKQYRTAALVTFGLLALIYVSTNLMFGRDDWYEVIIGIEVFLSFGLFVLLRRVMFERFDGVYLLGDDNRVYLNSNTVISLILAVVFFVYVRTRTTDFLVVLFRFPEEQDFLRIVGSVLRAAIIFATISLLAPTTAILLRLIVKEIPDQHHGAIEVKVNQDKLALDWAKFNEENDRYWSKNEVIDAPSQRQYLPDIRRVNPTQNALSTLTDGERWDVACDEFLNGLEDESFTTDERSWQGVRLTRSGYNLTAIGDKIRDTLIRDHWAEWNHPTQKNQGWRLLAPIAEIRENWTVHVDPKRKALKQPKIKKEAGQTIAGEPVDIDYPIGD